VIVEMETIRSSEEKLSKQEIRGKKRPEKSFWGPYEMEVMKKVLLWDALPSSEGLACFAGII